MKIEAQDQGVDYTPQTAMISRNGFFFPVTVPSKGTMLSMKLATLLARAKGRDFYDSIFLWQQAQPDYDFLRQRAGIDTPETLKSALIDKLDTVNLELKRKDFEHLLFNPSRSAQILHFRQFIDSVL